MAKGRTRQVARVDLPEGIARCMKNSVQLLTETELLLDHGHANHAASLYSLALEEAGKALLLRDAWEKGDAIPEVEGLDAHVIKLARAELEFGTRMLELRPGGTYWGPVVITAMDPGLYADLETRTQGLYVDYVAGAWRDPKPFDPDVLRQRIGELRKALANEAPP